MGSQDRILISIGADGVSIDAPSISLSRASTSAHPIVRSVWGEQGGTYAGIVTPWDGAPSYGLIAALVPEAKIKRAKFGPTAAMPAVSSRWDGASNMRTLLDVDPSNEIANRIRDLEVGGFSDWHWPSRIESAHLYASLGDQIQEFLGVSAAWICEQRPGFPSDAYVQYFGDGGQDWGHKDDEFGAVAVRRVY